MRIGLRPEYHPRAKAPPQWLLQTLMPVVLAMAVLLLPLRAVAQDWTSQPFDAATLSPEDRATVQAALAFSGDYLGTISGVWNKESDQALTKWVQREGGNSQPAFRDLAPLVLALEDERVKYNWQLFYDKGSNVSYLHPFGLLKKVKNDGALEFLSEDNGFSMLIRVDGFEDMKGVHEWFLGKAKSGTKPFHYTDDQTWITWTEIDDGFQTLARSDLNNQQWTSFSVVTAASYYPQLNLLGGSIMKGSSPASLIWTPGGVIDQVINGGGAKVAEAPSTAPSGPKDQVRRPLPPGAAAPSPSFPTGPGTAPAGTPAPPSGGPAAPPVDVATVVPGPAPGAKPADGTLGVPAPGAAPSGLTEPPPLATPPLGTPAPGTAAAPPLGTPPPSNKPPLGTPAPGGVASAAPADGPAPIRAPDGGTAVAGVSPVAAPPAPKSAGSKPSGKPKGSGSGFYITPDTLVTAAHVVEGCGSVTLADGSPLQVLASDPDLDLATLKGGPESDAWLRLSALEVPKLGEAVTAIGYPYFTSLDQGMTVTSGNVSALRGVDGSANVVMISAPVQPGNSGGPLLNKKGAVIGVVVSRIDDLAMLEETGSLPQNMNFAVPSGPLLHFLAFNRIQRQQGQSPIGDLSGDLPERMANAVVPLHCYP